MFLQSFTGNATGQEQGTLGKYFVTSQRNSLLLRKKKQELAPRTFQHLLTLRPNHLHWVSEVSGAAAGISQSLRSVWAPVLSQQEAPVVEKVTFMSCWRKEVEKGNRLIRREAEDQSQMRYTPPVTWVELPIIAPSES